MSMQRRDFLKAIGAGVSTAALSACAVSPSRSGPKVVIVGGGYGGATIAKYLSMWSNGTLDITLVEPNAEFVSCPLSNLVLGGSKQMSFLTDQLRGPREARHQGAGGHRAGDRPGARHRAHLEPAGPALRPRRAVARNRFPVRRHPGPGHCGRPGAKVLHAWKAGPQTVALAAAARGDARRRRVRAVDPAVRPIGARPDPTSARARSRGTSSAPNRAARC